MIDNIKDGIVSAGKYVSENASIATSKANTKLNLKTKEDVLEKEYANLGREYFNTLTKKDKNKYKNILDLEKRIEHLEYIAKFPKFEHSWVQYYLALDDIDINLPKVFVYEDMGFDEIWYRLRILKKL